MAFCKTPARNGFTLVEMLVALFVFGLISAAGVALLRSSSDGQLLLRDKLGERATLSRISNLVEADLAQAVPRPVRGAGGIDDPAFESRDNVLFAFSRIGASPDPESTQSSLARVTYRFDQGRLLRNALPFADGASDAVEAVLVEELKDATIRMRDEAGEWRDNWSANDTDLLPRAVELKLTTADGRDYRMLFLVGAVVRPPEKQDGEDFDG